MPRLREPPTAKPHYSQRSQWYRSRRRFEKFVLMSFKLPAPLAALPVRFRPIFMALSILSVLVLLVLGMHPTLSGRLRVNDKVQHFLGLSLSTGLFYFIFEVEDASRRLVMWRLLPEILTVAVCFIGGGIVSEYMQSLLPYKTFQLGDVVANLAGSTLGLLVSRAVARRMRHRREIAQLYQPLDDIQSSDEAEDEEATLGLGGRPEMSESPTEPRRKARVQDVWRDDSSDGFSLHGGEEEGDLSSAELDAEIARLDR